MQKVTNYLDEILPLSVLFKIITYVENMNNSYLSHSFVMCMLYHILQNAAALLLEEGKNTLPSLGTVTLTLRALHNYQNATSHFTIVFRPATLPPAFISFRKSLKLSCSSRKSLSCICVLTGSMQDWKCTGETWTL